MFKDAREEGSATEEQIAKIKEKLKLFHKQSAAKQIMQMNLFSDLDGFIYYNELLFHLMKFKQLDSINKDLSEEGFYIIQKEEIKNLHYLIDRRKKEMRQFKK